MNATITQRKYSKKREAILDVLRCSTEHPSAEMIYRQLKPVYADLSLGTVYRNLSFFLENGDVVCVGNVNGQERYDADTSDHAHFICSGCNCVRDVSLKGSIASLYALVEAETGAAVKGHNLLFRGHCLNCGEKRGE